VHSVSALRWNLRTVKGLKSYVANRLVTKLIILCVQIVRNIALRVVTSYGERKNIIRVDRDNIIIEDNAIEIIMKRAKKWLP